MDLAKKTILVFIDWFYPGYKAGGPIQSCVNFAYAMQQEYDIYIFTTDTDHGERVPYPDIVTDQWIGFQTTGIRIWYAQMTHLDSRSIRKAISDVNPDFIYLNSMYSLKFVLYPLWLKYTNKVQAKVILCPRGALYDSALTVKRLKKVPFLKLFNLLRIQKKIIFQATNDRERGAIEKHFKGSTIRTVDDFMATNQQPWQSCCKIPGELKMVYIARIFPIKNLLFTLESLANCKAKVKFSIVGPVEDQTYWEICRAYITRLPDNIEVNYMGPRTNVELHQILLDNHLYVLPTTGESFGHSIFESLLAGRPVLISDQTPWLGLQQEKVGWDLPLDDQEKFTRALESANGWTQEEFDHYALSAWQYASNYIKSSDILVQYRIMFS